MGTPLGGRRKVQATEFAFPVVSGETGRWDRQGLRPLPPAPWSPQLAGARNSAFGRGTIWAEDGLGGLGKPPTTKEQEDDT